MREPQSWRYFDWPLFGAVLALCFIGIAMVYSAGYTDAVLETFWVRQALFVGLGLVALFFMAFLDYRHLEIFAPPSLLLFIGLLVLVAVFGTDTSNTGAQRWLAIGGNAEAGIPPIFSFQPTELGKFMLILYMAWYLSRFQNSGNEVVYLLVALLLLLAPLYLVYQQPDLGMTLTLAFIGGTLILVNGVRYRLLIALTAASLFGAVVAFLSGFTLKAYMLERICIFLPPWAINFLGRLLELPSGCFDPSKLQSTDTYNIDQALIAVGAGGWFGEGWTQGTQNQLRFLRVRHSDFIFSVIAEELGFVGTLIILTLLFFVVWRLLHIADSARDSFGRLLAYGVGSIIFFQLFINVGMNMKIMPVTGLTLPFVSYGGSSLVSMMAAVGLAQSVAMRHRKIDFS